MPAHPPATSTGVTSRDPTCRGHDGAIRLTIGPVRVHRTRTQPCAYQASPIGTDAGRLDSRLSYAVSRTGTSVTCSAVIRATRVLGYPSRRQNAEYLRANSKRSPTLITGIAGQCQPS